MDILRSLDRSRATAEFKAAILAYLGHEGSPLIETTRYAPRVKVVRVLTQLLAAEPELPVERVRLEAVSGCSDFRGTVTVQVGEETRAFDFVWCCQWRADEEGWVDAYGFPDQIRAAREFDWQCFQRWQAA